MTNDTYAHLTEKEIQDYLNCKLNEEKAGYVIRHLKKCSSCLRDLKKEIKKQIV